MKKTSSIYHVTVCTVFIGILLTFSIFYLVNIALERENVIAPQCYDGSVVEADQPFAGLYRAVYQSKGVLNLVHEYQYRLFGTVNSTLAIAGKNDFLFEIKDTENNYNYIEDYIGNQAFTDEQMKLILRHLRQTQATYEKRDAEYLLVIIPNSQTVYSECMPAYLGSISESTRLAVLNEYLLDHDFYHFIDLTEDLRAAKADGLLYNNTENSLNSLGLYYTYQAVYQRFTPSVLANTEMIKREELNFYQHLTTGKGAARKAGLDDVVNNHTISLSNRTKLNYRFVHNESASSTTFKLPFYIPSDTSHSPEMLLQFSNTWERLQIEPYFSNTFSKVTYQTDLSDDAAIFKAASPRVVIQFIYENQLSQLLP